MALDDAPSAQEDTATPETPQAVPSRSRKQTKNIVIKHAAVYSHLPDATEESCNSFQVINECLYGSKYMGSSDTDTLDCECAEDWSMLPFNPIFSWRLTGF